MAAKKRARRRPRIHELGSRTVYTVLSPKMLGAIEKMVVAERRTISMMVAVLVEEALRTRGELK